MQKGAARRRVSRERRRASGQRAPANDKFDAAAVRRAPLPAVGPRGVEVGQKTRQRRRFPRLGDDEALGGDDADGGRDGDGDGSDSGGNDDGGCRDDDRRRQTSGRRRRRALSIKRSPSSPHSPSLGRSLRIVCRHRLASASRCCKSSSLDASSTCHQKSAAAARQKIVAGAASRLVLRQASCPISCRSVGGRWCQTTTLTARRVDVAAHRKHEARC